MDGKVILQKTSPQPSRSRFSLGRLLLTVFLLVIVIADLFPLIWLIDFSLLKSGDFFGSDILIWPDPPMWKNYKDAFINAHIPLLFFNSVFVCLISILVIIACSILLGYAFTRMEWRGRKTFFSLFMVGMIIPIYSTLLPNFIIFNKFGIIDTYWALILPYIAFSIPLSMFIMTGFMETLPRAVEEAAVIDGLNVWGIIFRIILPMLKPAIATVTVIAFLNCWNEFIMAVTYIDSDTFRTLPFAVVYFMGQYSSNYGAQFAVLSIIALPTVIIYLLFTDQITEGITSGAVKG